MQREHRHPLRRLIRGNLGQDPAKVPDQLLFAGWLEGRLTPEQSAEVEAWLVTDPALRRALIDVHSTASQPLSDIERRRAETLIGTGEPLWPEWLAWLFAPLPVWAMAAGVAGIGFWLGSGLGAVESQQQSWLLAQLLTGVPW